VNQPSELASSPELFPLNANPAADSVQVVPLSEADYAAASFLDRRMMTPARLASVRNLPWATVSAAAMPLREHAHWIFHISHVGSTLLSRLLGEHPSLFCLREPAILRTLAEVLLAIDHPKCVWNRATFAERLPVFLKLFSRTFRAEQTAVIKATSFVSEMAEGLLSRDRTARAVLMYVTPVTFLRSLLDGAMSDIEDQAEKRLYRLHQRLRVVEWRLGSLSPGERVAMSWLAEMMALQAAATRVPSGVFWLDFDRFLANTRAEFHSVLQHFGVSANPTEVEEILGRPILRQYSKKPPHPFDAATRQQLLAQAESRHGTEVRKGLHWLETAAKKYPKIAALVQARDQG
jgi:hypothetical protein